MIQTLNPFLNFNGTCRKAMDLYAEVLGAEVVDIMPWAPEMFEGDVPANMKDGVMYAKLKIGASELELSDMPPHMKAERGSNTHVILHVGDPAKLDAIYEALGAGGEPEMPPEDMFWGARYAKLRDRFGISWALHCPLEAPK